MATTPRQHLPRAQDRVGILRLEHTKLRVREGALAAESRQHGPLQIPAATLSAIILGPGCSITHDAAALLADAAVTALWTGAGEVRSYASIVPLANGTALMEKHIQCWADPDTRYQAALRAYRHRFPGVEPPTAPTFDALRAAEGRRVRDAYHEVAAAHGLTWSRRQARWNSGDTLNQAITSATQALYGAATTATLALGCIPALGFIHTGHRLSFVFDLADLHKTRLAVPVACEAVATGKSPDTVTRSMNLRMKTDCLLATMIEDIYAILDLPDPAVNVSDNPSLWDGPTTESSPSGPNYGVDW